MDKYYWSFNREQEIYRNGADTIKECIDEARKDNELHHRMYASCANEFIYIGESELYLIPVVNSDIILEQFRENAYDNCGEAAEDWLFSHSREQEVELDERLTEIMIKWIKETGQVPSFSKFKSIKKYNLETGEELNEDGR